MSKIPSYNAVAPGTQTPVVNTDEWAYSDQKSRGKGKGPVVYVNKSATDRDPIRFALGNLNMDPKATSIFDNVDIPSAIFGVKGQFDETKDDTTRTVSLSAPTDAMLAFARKIDQSNLRQGVQNAKKWFPENCPKTIDEMILEWAAQYKKDNGREPTAEEEKAQRSIELRIITNYVKSQFKPLVNENRKPRKKDGKIPVREDGSYYPPHIEAKIYKADVDVSVMEPNSKVMKTGTWESIVPGCKIFPICEVSSLWFSSLGWGMTLTIVKCIVQQQFVAKKPISKGVDAFGLPDGYSVSGEMAVPVEQEQTENNNNHEVSAVQGYTD
jgi:hypothetical protein